MVTIYTHSQTFHPDELLAIALLQRTVLADEQVTIRRTRDEAVLAQAKADPNAFVIDVGFEYNPSQRNFDHHQKGMTAAWPDGTPYSACGLVWTWLKEQGALRVLGPIDVIEAFEERVVLPADRHDNGIGAPWPEGEFIGGYNRTGANADPAFERALAVTREFLENTHVDLLKDYKAKKRMEQALGDSGCAQTGLVIIEDQRAMRFPYWAARLSQGAVDLVITQRDDGNWTLTSTPETLDDPFSIHAPAPEAWRGKQNIAVPTALGDIPLLFCHKSGFLSVVEGPLTHAIAVAQAIRAELGRDAHPVRRLLGP